MQLELLRNARIIAQSRPSSNAAVSVCASPQGVATTITAVNIVNTTGSAALYSMYLDDNGTTYDATTAVGGFNTSLAANTAVLISFGETGLPLTKSSAGNFAVQTATANALTFTVIGVAQ